MSTWGTIETAVTDALEAITSGGSAAFATVRGQTHRDRKGMIAAISRERLPAACVVATGRDAGDKSTRRPGRPVLSVLLATGSLRSEREVRTGSDEMAGVFELSESVASALGDLLIGGDRRLLLVDEKPAGGEEGMIVWEQRYELRRQSDTSAPTFGGVALAGADSEVRVELGVLRRATSSFSFPGIDGVFERHLGVRDRPISWRGQLRAANDTALNALEASIEDELRTSEAKTIADNWSRSHEQCVLKSFERRGPRQRDELSGEALQDFEIEFTQLVP